MENLKTLLENSEHEKILELPSPEFDRYKVIAAIHLDRYEDGLAFASKNSFELAYIHYKLKNFKKSLKILRKLHGTAVDVLKSQCLYFLGYYSEAYKLLSQHGSSDEYAVNLSAMESLSYLNTKSPIRPTLFTTRDTGAVDPVRYKFTNPECLFESEFNAAFKSIEDERAYIEQLRVLDQKYRVENGCVQKQIGNLTGEHVDNMSKREGEIVSFNLGKSGKIDNPVLFQHNFLSYNTDFAIFKRYKSNKSEFIRGVERFEPCSDRLRILKALIMAQRRPSERRSHAILKAIRGCKECVEKDILELLCSGCTEQEFQQRGLQIVVEFNKS